MRRFLKGRSIDSSKKENIRSLVAFKKYGFDIWAFRYYNLFMEFEFNRKLNFEFIQKNLQDKYFHAFYFYMAKSINEILVDYPSPSNIMMKDFKTYDESREFFKKMYLKKEISIKLKEATKTNDKSQFYIQFPDYEISMILGKRLKKQMKKNNFIEDKEFDELEYEYKEKFLDNLMLQDNMEYSTQDISFSWTVHNIYSPEESPTNSQKGNFNVLVNKNIKPDSKVRNVKQTKIKHSNNTLNDSSKRINLSNSDRLSPKVNTSKKMDTSIKTKELSLTNAYKEFKFRTNTHIPSNNKEGAKIKVVKIPEKMIEIPKLAIKPNSKIVSIEVDRTIKTERQKSSKGSFLNSSEVMKDKVFMKLNSIKGKSPKKNIERKIQPEQISIEHKIKSEKPIVKTSRPASSIKNEYFVMPSKLHKAPKTSSARNSAKNPKTLPNKREISKLQTDLINSYREKSQIDGERMKQIMALTQEGKGIFNEFKKRTNKEVYSASGKKAEIKAKNFQTGNGFWTSRNVMEVSNEFDSIL